VEEAEAEDASARLCDTNRIDGEHCIVLTLFVNRNIKTTGFVL
jgi:hypothetical protein